MLDLCCGRLGWSKAFLSRGWECVGVDLVAPPSIPPGFTFFQCDILELDQSLEFGRLPFSEGWRYDVSNFDFACASTPCEEFSVWGQKHFHPNPKYPENGIKVFNHTRSLLEASGIPFVMENVRPAEQFIGAAVNHCGPFFFWGTAVPPILPQGITKSKWKPKDGRPGNWSDSFMGTKSVRKAATATIPPELAACVADYAGRICEVNACT